MSLQNGAIIGDEALLWFDTAFVNKDSGEVVCFADKACHGHLWPFAVALSTIGGDPLDIMREIGSGVGPLNLADLLDTAQRALRRYCQPGYHARALVAAYEGGPRLFMVANDRWHPDVAPYEPGELSDYCSSGNRLAPYLFSRASGWTPDLMLAQIDGQRGEAHDNPAAGIGAGHWIGGNAVEMRVDASGVTSRVVREWGDAVGERIRPMAAISYYPAGLSGSSPEAGGASLLISSEAERAS